jgi:hypothetical protein
MDQEIYWYLLGIMAAVLFRATDSHRPPNRIWGHQEEAHDFAIYQYDCSTMTLFLKLKNFIIGKKRSNAIKKIDFLYVSSKIFVGFLSLLGLKSYLSATNLIQENGKFE